MPSTTRLAVAGAGFVAAAILAMPRAGLLARTQAPAPPAAQSPSGELPATPPGPPAPTPAQVAAQEAAVADRKDMMEQARHQGTPAGPERQRAGAESRQLRRGDGQSLSEPARRADVEERPEGHDRRACGGTQRRPEIVEDFEREVLGRVPKNVPKVTWTVTRTVECDGRPAIRWSGKQLVGHVDNSRVSGDQRRHPDDAGHAGGRARTGAGDDDVRRRLPPARRSSAGRTRLRRCAAGRAPAPPAPPADPPATEQLIADGWGYASLNPGQHSGRQRRRPDQGHHRPGQQGPAAQAGRLGRAARVGVGRVARPRLSRDRQRRRREEGRHRRRLALRQGGAGHDGVRSRASRSSWSDRRAKAAPSCIAATSAKRSRTSPARGEYHWMAGNFLKYGAAESTFGSKNAGDIPGRCA